MTTTSFLVALLIVVVTTVFAALLASSFLVWRLRLFERRSRSVPMEVTCPKTGQPLKVRLTLGEGVDGPCLNVVSCERWGSDDLHCGGECVCQLMVGARGGVRTDPSADPC